MTLEQIEDDADVFFEKALEINPNLQRASAERAAVSTRGESGKKSGSSVGIILIVIVIIVIVLIAF